MSNFFRYNWELHGQTARFLVDLDYAGKFDLMGDFITLIHVTCLPVDPSQPEFSRRERARLETVAPRCMEILGQSGAYVGAIDIGPQRRLYFYVSDARLLVPIFDLCSNEKGLTLACAKADEPHRQTYYRLLMPDEAKKQSAANEAYIAELRQRGDDTAAYRRINLHLRFPTIFAASAFLREAKEAGFALGRDSYTPEQELPHETTVHAVSRLLWNDVTTLTTRAIRLAEPYGGVLNSVDSAFVERRFSRA